MTEWVKSINLYYMLCYAWERLSELELLQASEVGEHESSGNLLARVLIAATRDAMRRGLDRDYVTVEEDVCGVRGRVDLPATLARLLIPNARTRCRFDELSLDTPSNRILKSTIGLLSRAQDVHLEQRQALRGLSRRMEGISDQGLGQSAFRRFDAHRNNRQYTFLLSICRLAQRRLLVNHQTGAVRFRDFSRGPEMRLLFQWFLRRFFEREAPHLRVSAPRGPWSPFDGSPKDARLMPELQTDVLLADDNRWLILEAKFTNRTLDRDPFSGEKRLRSSHLFQLYAYVRNLSLREAAPASVEGMIVYPKILDDVTLDVRLHGFRIYVRTIDLSQPWTTIHQQLLSMIA